MDGMRMIRKSMLAATAFFAGTGVDPAPAYAHCGGHSGSCDSFVVADTYCSGSHSMYQRIEVWAGDCSGTCYNGGSSGCCTSPEACNDAPCKPGGCGGPCAYMYSYEQYIGACE